MASPEEDYTRYYILTHPHFVPGIQNEGGLLVGFKTIPWKHFTLIKSRGSDSTSGGAWIQSFLVSLGLLDEFKLYSAAYKFYKKVDKFPPILFFRALTGEEPLPGIFSSALKRMIKFDPPVCLIPVRTGLQVWSIDPSANTASKYLLLTKGEKGALTKFYTDSNPKKDIGVVTADFPLSDFRNKISPPTSAPYVGFKYAPNDVIGLIQGLSPLIGTFHHVPATTANHKTILGLPITTSKDPICKVISLSTATTSDDDAPYPYLDYPYIGLKVSCPSPTQTINPLWFQLAPAKVEISPKEERGLFKLADFLVNTKLNGLLFADEQEYLPAGLKKPLSSLKGTLGLLIQNQIAMRFPSLDLTDPSLYIYLTSSPAGPVGNDRLIGEVVIDPALIEKDELGDNVAILDLAEPMIFNMAVGPPEMLRDAIKDILESNKLFEREPDHAPEERLLKGHNLKGDRPIPFTVDFGTSNCLDLFVQPNLSLFIFQDESYLTTRIQETQLTLEDSPTWETVHELNRLLTKRWFSDL